MRPTVVDPRDTSWESNRADFRVEFSDGITCTTYEFTATEFDQVIQWATTNAPTTMEYRVALRTLDINGQWGLVWLKNPPLYS